MAALGLGLSVLAVAPARAVDVGTCVKDRLERLGTLRRAGILEIGRSRHGRAIDAVVLTEECRDRSLLDQRVRILVISGQHGNEPTPVRASLDLADELAAGSRSFPGDTLSKFVIAVVPMVNPDGFAVGTRLNSVSVDLNRDWSGVTQPETAAVIRFIKNFRPQVVIDLHEWTSDDPHTPDCIEAPLYGDSPQHRLARRLADVAWQSGKGSPLPLRPIEYSHDSDPRLSHRALLSRGICSFLVETDPDEATAVRVGAYLGFVQSIVRTIGQSSDPVVSKSIAAIRKPWDADRVVARTSAAPKAVKTAAVRPKSGSYWLLISIGGVCLLATAAYSRKTSAGSMEVCAVTARARSICAISSDLPVRTRRTLMRERSRPSDRTK